MLRIVEAGVERWPLRIPFRIARGTRNEAELIVVRVSQGTAEGYGECSPNARYGETLETAMAQIEEVSMDLCSGLDRNELAGRMPAGSARCAIDCALWDLEASLGRSGSMFERRLEPILCARTIGIATPEEMAKAAAGLADCGLIKIKLDGSDAERRLRAVRESAPASTLIVDANESWSIDQVVDFQPLLAELKIALLEQPLPAALDEALSDVRASVPICADESCHVAADIPGLRDRYQMVNIKLDKTGGLTEALRLRNAARAADMGVMVGCMIGTSLSMAPAFHLAADADYADLDGPWLLMRDRPGGIGFHADGSVSPPLPGFWGPTSPARRRAGEGDGAGTD